LLRGGASVRLGIGMARLYLDSIAFAVHAAHGILKSPLALL
jgi:hypothetical protein